MVTKNDRGVTVNDKKEAGNIKREQTFMMKKEKWDGKSIALIIFGVFIVVLIVIISLQFAKVL